MEERPPGLRRWPERLSSGEDVLGHRDARREKDLSPGKLGDHSHKRREAGDVRKLGDGCQQGE